MQLKEAIRERFDDYFIDLIDSNSKDFFLKCITEMSESQDAIDKVVSWGAKFLYKKVASGLSFFQPEIEAEHMEKRICAAYDKTIEYISTIIDDEDLILLHVICQNANDTVFKLIQCSAKEFVNEHAIGEIRRKSYVGKFSKIGQGIDGLLNSDDMRRMNLAKGVRKALLTELDS